MQVYRYFSGLFATYFQLNGFATVKVGTPPACVLMQYGDQSATLCKGGSLTVESMDVRPGGGYRYVQRMPGSPPMVFVGSYVEAMGRTDLLPTELRETRRLRHGDPQQRQILRLAHPRQNRTGQLRERLAQLS